MSRFTDEQKRIALLLLSSPKTVEDLNKQLGIPFDDLNDSLKQMVRLKLVKVEGYPSKYKLMENIVTAVRRRKEIAEKDPFDMRIKAVIEIRAVEEDFLKKNMDTLEKKLRENKNYTIYDIYRAKAISELNHYTAYLEVNMSAKDFTSLVQFMYFFGPTSVEVLKPQKVVLSMDDLQDALMEMAEMIQSYNASMLKSMSKDELEEFAKGLYQPKK
ncbi:MAG: hypothetical protein NUV67_00240 [archaeon]|nr:hypothetical protein [archaeon]